MWGLGLIFQIWALQSQNMKNTFFIWDQVKKVVSLCFEFHLFVRFQRALDDFPNFNQTEVSAIFVSDHAYILRTSIILF